MSTDQNQNAQIETQNLNLQEQQQNQFQQQQPPKKLESYKDLKEQNFPKVYNRKGTDTETKLSQEEIQFLNNQKMNLFKYPFLSLAGMFLVNKSISFFNKPGVLSNPLQPDERMIVRGKFFKYFISNQMLFFAFMGGFVYAFMSYEFSKYYMFLKHRRLVNCYLDAVENNYLDNLKKLGYEAEQVLAFQRDQSLKNVQPTEQQIKIINQLQQSQEKQYQKHNSHQHTQQCQHDHQH
ncbi:hypothetical protein PPERSA_12279 [Pseudocohnilembus persalinus]|uniref:Transmembrane protein n=1 Tax=Pseudocohnilembus persalinus TaxID=266149 RepID=A0A0V0R5A3_PSEPJ|nr:hypothetical protein PPERSA_12279 [Pseudocohnilembus persalinus]|eukprot:KRX09536.1 hypothetical protein PPERSA_12279 [Pseudocohnilembus persalinus]